LLALNSALEALRSLLASLGTPGSLSTTLTNWLAVFGRFSCSYGNGVYYYTLASGMRGSVLRRRHVILPQTPPQICAHFCQSY
jgi:hypothetical protein